MNNAALVPTIVATAPAGTVSPLRWLAVAAGPAGAAPRSDEALAAGRRERQRDGERRSEAEAGTLDVHPPSVELHDLRDDRQADPESGHVEGRRVRLAVDLEDVRQEVGGDAGAGIDDGQTRVVALPHQPDSDLPSRRRELDGVAEEIPDDLQQPHAIAAQRRRIEDHIQSDPNAPLSGTVCGHLQGRPDDG